MAKCDPVYTAHQLQRWMAPNAHRFVRPDWRRFVQPGSDLWSVYELCERKYNPNQPRVPAGSREGGQWASDGTPSGSSKRTSRAKTVELSAASRKGSGGHHEMPRAVSNKLNLPDETRKVFDEATTGPVPTRGPRWDDAHRKYNEAVGELTKDFMKKNGIQPEQMTPDQARSLLKATKESPNPIIRDYNMGIRMLQYMYRLPGGRGGGRGNE
ncbi:MAG: hypothetical protein HY244_12075 [Rhizobiales bacterium]|nr:hypothetical protein [Hyphomicrobiales bacterium]